MESEGQGQAGDQDSRTIGGIHPTETSVIPRAWSFAGRVALELDLSVFSRQAALRAAYKFTDRCYVFLGLKDETTLLAVLAPKRPDSPGDFRALVGEFSNEVLDQRLRESLAQEFGDVQRLVVAQAFAEGNLLDPNRDDVDYQTDPRGIRQRR